MLQAAVSDPRVRLIEIGASFLEARALHIVAEKRIPDLLAGGEVRIEELAQKAGLEALKLGSSMVGGVSYGITDLNRKNHAHPLLPPRLRRGSTGCLRQ